jgi:hypothetical protein
MAAVSGCSLAVTRSGSSMNGRMLARCFMTSAGVFAWLMPSSLTTTTRSASKKGIAPNLTGTSAPSSSSIFSSSTPRTGEVVPKRFCTAGLVRPAL